MFLYFYIFIIIYLYFHISISFRYSQTCNESDDFLLQTDRHFIIIYISSTNLRVCLLVLTMLLIIYKQSNAKSTRHCFVQIHCKLNIHFFSMTI